ncbi:hypothetical protein Pyn_36387 [Prunus yedoensis var. nudiflora]|uniref:Uncharacterized protein n=1 Tax=Prunus yedoensis var. nudiflora TaxID=2094558 RepID=A0A314XQU1_PRUYE|nr:hypothetical protein Pyn_36387 [Prunus yedoensis var. nudiflora]
MDGLWSSCGDERIVVFTTNHNDDDDDAALERVVKVTPAEICEELLKKNDRDEDEDEDAALEIVVEGLIILKRQKCKHKKGRKMDLE